MSAGDGLEDRPGTGSSAAGGWGCRRSARRSAAARAARRRPATGPAPAPSAWSPDGRCRRRPRGHRAAGSHSRLIRSSIRCRVEDQILGNRSSLAWPPGLGLSESSAWGCRDCCSAINGAETLSLAPGRIKRRGRNTKPATAAGRSCCSCCPAIGQSGSVLQPGAARPSPRPEVVAPPTLRGLGFVRSADGASGRGGRPTLKPAPDGAEDGDENQPVFGSRYPSMAES